jgi:NDP-sugar pyrophosphorylase family protein
MGGKSVFFDSAEHYFPKPLVEVQGVMMIERVLRSLDTLIADKRYLFVVNRRDDIKFYLKNVLTLLTDGRCVVVEQKGDAAGALCSCLLQIENIGLEDPLIICNSDQVIDVDYNEVLRHFESQNADAGTIVFKSVHPQWSYVALDANGTITETAEKRPISQNAIAGFYYFRRGKDFIEAAMRVVEKGVTLDEKFYISMTFNELILKNRKLVTYRIPDAAYHSFYSPQRIAQFEALEKRIEAKPAR